MVVRHMVEGCIYGDGKGSYMAVKKVFTNLSFSKKMIATLCGVVNFRGVVNYSADRSFGACFCRQCGGGISDPVVR